MKNILLILGFSLLLLNCSEDTLDTYHGNDGIYFAPNMLGKYIDSTSFSFAMVTVDDTVVNMAVRLYGEVRDYDRPFRVEVEKATGESGIDYEPLLEEYVLLANKAVADSPLRIFLHGSAKNYLTLRILPNEYFTQLLALKVQDEDTLNMTRKTLIFTSKLTQPKNWYEWAFGYFSEAKYKLVNELGNIDPEVWNANRFPSQYYYQLPLLITNYLNSKIAEGPESAIKDPDPQSTRGYMTLPDVVIPSSFPDAWPEKE